MVLLLVLVVVQLLVLGPPPPRLARVLAARILPVGLDVVPELANVEPRLPVDLARPFPQGVPPLGG